MLAEILLTLKSLAALAGLLQDLISEVKSLRLATEQRNLDQLKSDINEKIEILKNAKTDDDRKRALLDIANRMQK